MRAVSLVDRTTIGPHFIPLISSSIPVILSLFSSSQDVSDILFALCRPSVSLSSQSYAGFDFPKKILLLRSTPGPARYWTCTTKYFQRYKITITTRVQKEQPLVLSLEAGEFSDINAIVIDDTFSMFLAAMKTAGFYYEELDCDALCCHQTLEIPSQLSPMGQLLYSCLTVLGNCPRQSPHKRQELGVEILLTTFEQAVNNDPNARQRLINAFGVTT